jgi:hypothetical protein
MAAAAAAGRRGAVMMMPTAALFYLLLLLLLREGLRVCVRAFSDLSLPLSLGTRETNGPHS